MTRENKVALVVGFGLILLVGILISDHLSDARTQKSADLAPVDPLSESSTHNDPPLIDLQVASDSGRGGPSSGPPQDTTVRLAQNLDETRDGVRTIHLPDLQAYDRPAPGPGASGSAASQLLFHDVRPGESLSSICAKNYGDASLADELAQYNGISDPHLVRTGRRLRIPPPAALIGGGAIPQRPVADDGSPRYRTYTIKPGDSLSEIAQRLLRSARKWEQLYELNRDVLSDPDDIRVGAVIKIPLSP